MLKEPMPRRLPPGCIEQTDGRTDTVRVYYRPTSKSKKIRLRGVPWTEDFMSQYEAAKGNAPKDLPKLGVRPETWGWLCAKYIAECADYKRLDESTRSTRKRILDSMCAEPIAPGSSRVFKDFPLAKMTADDLEVLRDRKLDLPEAANARVKAARMVTKWGKRKKHIKTNFGRDVETFKNATEGWHTWTLEEVEAFEKRWPIGTKPRLALALLMFTGVRKSDLVRLGKQHMKRGSLVFTIHKGRNVKPKRLSIPILPELQRVMDATPTGDLTFLVTAYGKAFTDKGMGVRMRDWCDRAGLPHCSAHGLRKAGATLAAENGATASQLMAIFGWSSMEHAELYTRSADQKRLAADAMHLIVPQNAGLSPKNAM